MDYDFYRLITWFTARLNRSIDSDVDRMRQRRELSATTFNVRSSTKKQANTIRMLVFNRCMQRVPNSIDRIDVFADIKQSYDIVDISIKSCVGKAAIHWQLFHPVESLEFDTVNQRLHSDAVVTLAGKQNKANQIT